MMVPFKDVLPVSVIIPTYNRARFLERAIESVLRQSADCAEIIIVDDGSTDDTLSVVEAFKELSQVPLQYLFNKENQGPAAARNKGVRHAKFDVIAFLDSDDHWRKKKLEYQYRTLMAENKYLISHTWESWFRRGVHLNQKKKHVPRHGDIFNHCLELCGVGMSTVMMRKKLFDLVGFFDESLRCCEDYDLWLRVSCRFQFLLVPERLTIKEGGREDQVSSVFRQGMDRFRIKSLVTVLKSSVLSPEQRVMAQKELYRKATIYYNGCIKHNRLKEAEEYQEIIQKYCDSALFPEGEDD